MELKGVNFIGNELSADGKETFKGVDPATDKKLLPDFHEASSHEIDEAINKAELAFTEYSKKNGKEKALFLYSAMIYWKDATKKQDCLTQD